MLDKIHNKMVSLSNSADAQFLQRFIKTGPGQYGEGDIFRGIRVPVLRGLAKIYRDIPLEQAELLLRSAYHEDRMLALLLLIRKYAASDATVRSLIYRLYLENTHYINNWDLVDVSAEHILGAFLSDKGKEPLYLLARSDRIWERRMAILSTFHFIRRGMLDETLTIAGMMLTDTEDLIHKAVGWMIREVGKRDMHREEAFLRTHYRQMPRTMLRYEIERFPEERRQEYLKGTVSSEVHDVWPCSQGYYRKTVTT
jgi:3-methyladenine DNA glycosylase AlkD